jgi:hypothetical protein
MSREHTFKYGACTKCHKGYAEIDSSGCRPQTGEERWDELGAQMMNEQFLLTALEYSNAADDMQCNAFHMAYVAGQSSVGAGHPDVWKMTQPILERTGQRNISNVIAAFICWASGGARAIRREP